MYQDFIPFYGWTIFHYVFHMDVPYSVYSSADEYLDCFHFLAIMNIAAIKLHVNVFLWMYFFISLEYITRSRITGSYGTLHLTFDDMPNCFPKQLHHFKILPAMYEGSKFSTSLSTLVVVHLFLLWASQWVWDDIHYGFNLHFSND